jgi:hypothetical protein
MPGFVFYRGLSLIDNQPIIGVAIVTSGNAKTGDMVQTYIMPDGISPLDASKSGRDYSVCGNCKHRGKPTDKPAKKQAEERSCYVNLGQGPTIVFKGLQRGIYPDATLPINPAYKQLKRAINGRGVRMGTWGDPAAIPLQVWQGLIADAAYHTGYTHNTMYQPGIEQVCMVSADSTNEANEAKQKGNRTFRVIPIGTWQDKGKLSLLKHEILCPASSEGGSKVQCMDCRLCNGRESSGKSIAIVAHGSGKKYA